MAGLYVVSAESYSGKTAVCLGMAAELRDKGMKIGYMKPVGTLPLWQEGLLIDEDVPAFMELLKLEEAKQASPLVLTHELVDRALEHDDDYASKVKEAYEKSSSGKDLVLVEGAGDLDQGSLLGLSADRIAELIDVKVVIVIKLTSMMQVDKIIQAKERLGERLIGTVLISVPRSQRKGTEELLIPFLDRKDIPVLGILPKDRMLMSVSVGQLHEILGGEILCGEKYLDKQLETFMVGAMGAERALRYFRKKGNKAVITGGDRSDIQLSALETPTNCLILTGNMEPSPAVIVKAEELGVPVLLVSMDTYSAVQKLELLLGRVRLDLPDKLNRMRELIRENFDFQYLGETLGLHID